MIDVSKLEVGGVYSYKELCELTGAEYKRGKSRSLQMNGFGEDGFARFMKLEKIKYGKYMVKEIYETPLLVQNRIQSGNSSIYFKYIELIILKYLSKKYGTKEVIFSRRKLWLMLGMINEKYNRVDKTSLLRLGNNIVTEDDIEKFYLRCNSKLNYILKKALENLSKRRLIDYEERTIICKSYNNKHEHVVANIDEREQIIQIEFDVLQEFKCEDLNAIAYKRLTQKYYNRVKQIIFDNFRWEYYYKAYSIAFNHANINKTIPRIEETLDNAIKKLNSNIIKGLNKEADTIYKRELKKYNDLMEELGNHPENEEAWRKLRYTNKPSDTYIIAQNLLAAELIGITDNEPMNMMFDMTLLHANTDDDMELNELFNINE